MPSFKRISIDQKLTLLTLATVSLALLLSSAAFVLNEVSMMRAATVKQLSALADVVGANSTAAIEFDDPAAGQEILASLEREPSVELACLFRANGQIFARYVRRGAAPDFPPGPESKGHRFTDHGHLDLFKPLIHNGRQVGTIYVHASMDELDRQLVRYGWIVLAVMVGALLAALLVSYRLQRTISQPILALAGAAQQVSLSGDYSIRVAKQTQDELGTLYDQFNAMLDQIQQGQRELRQIHAELEQRVRERTRQLSETNDELSREVAERIRAEHELEETHDRLMQTARRAGMAEIATGVLHNVGNVLNGINVSATLVADRIRQLRVEQVLGIARLLEEHRHDLGRYLTEDAKGKQLPEVLRLLAEHLRDEQAEVVEELASMTTKVDHVKTIVVTQQNYAGVSGVQETFAVAKALDDAVKLQSAFFERHGITIDRDYADEDLAVTLDKQKLLQILVNLVKNAKDAIREAGGGERKLTFRTRRSAEGRLQIEVTDSGIGIPPENLTRIFSHGFTTKREGHGFGLHSCANAAKELGGSLMAYSDGVGQGATFVLDLPCECEIAAV